MDTTSMLAVSSVMLSDNSIMYSKFVYEWWMGPALFTAVSLLWARFWPFDTNGDELERAFRRPVFIMICLFLSMLAWIAGGTYK